ncbi:hypothetical protein FACS1894217_08520 [Clostridia bacterium]|nr:hypothetical protein FACS1894217_08520 [Clostridia bacterium]
MPELPLISAKKFLALLLKYGCEEVRVRGSHHRVLNPKNGKSSVLPVHSGRDLKRGTFAGILRQLGIDSTDFILFMRGA